MNFIFLVSVMVAAVRTEKRANNRQEYSDYISVLTKHLENFYIRVYNVLVRNITIENECLMENECLIDFKNGI